MSNVKSHEDALSLTSETKKARVTTRTVVETKTTTVVEEMETHYSNFQQRVHFDVDPRLFGEMYNHVQTNKPLSFKKFDIAHMSRLIRILMIDAGKSRYSHDLSNRQRHDMVLKMVEYFVLDEMNLDTAAFQYMKSQMLQLTGSLIDEFYTLAKTTENIFSIARTASKACGLC